MMQSNLWLRWSWRDLRKRWLQVVAVSLIIALGAGIFAGFGGQEKWRIATYDLSYGRLNMYDIHVELSSGSFIDQAQTEALLADINGIKRFETRLIVDTQVETLDQDGDTLLVSGELVGFDVSNGGPHVNSIKIEDGEGRNFTDADAGQNVAILDYKFARYYKLEPGDPVTIAGNVPLDFIGSGHTPEYFQIFPDGSIGFMGEGNFAPIYMPLQSVQQVTGRDGLINDIVILTQDGADRDAISATIKDVLAANFDNVGTSINYKEDNTVYDLLYADAEADQDTWNLLAILFLLGASLGAFNLAGRMIQAQRREIGIAMALGVPRRLIALRPMLVGLQIAVLGTIVGMILGAVFNRIFAGYVNDILPLPYYDISFDYVSFARGAIIGVVMPFLATLIPTWRAVSVQPIDAIRTGTVIAKSGGWSKLMNYLPLPGKSFTHMPFRNLLRAPWRTIFTAVGISAAIAMLTLFVGFLDTFRKTIDVSKDMLEYQGQDRVVVTLDFFYPEDSDAVRTVTEITDDDGLKMIDDWQGNVTLGGTLKHSGEEIDTAITLLDMDSDIWVPKLKEGSHSTAPQTIIIAEKMAEDLNVKVGDSITVEHPRREGTLAFNMTDSTFEVVGIHTNPFRPLSYASLTNRDVMGIAGLVNELYVVPRDDLNIKDVREELFTQNSVGGVQGIDSIAAAFDEALELFEQFLSVTQFVVVFLAFLIAFNSTSINVDERVREIATMFAFGLPIRTVTRMQVVENFVIGILGTLLGIALGYVFLVNMLAARVEEQIQDMKFIIDISPQTLFVSVLLGVLVVALTPLLSIRKMSKMSIPDELRVME